ncbi:MAG: ligase-associated DNA damage response DEXH box helicase [Rhodospirillales bacterium]
MYGSVGTPLPTVIAEWFKSRGWTPHAHQLEMLEAAAAGESVLLIAPPGGGKTLASFLPTIAELAGEAAGKPHGLHTLYVSPLKALTVDVHRNLSQPIAEMRLPICAETCTGDTPAAKRRRQRTDPPHLLLTTPETLARLLSYADAPSYFTRLRCVIVDELHALVGGKRGDLLALGLARLLTFAPGCRRVGLSATVAWPEELRRWLATPADRRNVRLITSKGGRDPDARILRMASRLPWSGHMARYALPHVYDEIRGAKTTIIFVNTRAQAEVVFRELWHLNSENLPIALHHGSLSVERRRKVEAAAAAGRLRAVVATSSLDLGVDWASVDLVIQVGAPKGVSRLVQRIGRAGHRSDVTSRAVLVPANRFEMLECQAALDGAREGTLDGERPGPGGLDVLAQHLLGCACAGPIFPDVLYGEVRTADPYRDLTRADFDETLRFVEYGGYALAGYAQFRRLVRSDDGWVRLASAQVARRYRMNIGTIVEAAMLKVKLRRGPILGEVEESFVQGLVPGDTFVFAGEILRFEGIKDMIAVATRTAQGEPKVPAYAGGRLPLSTHLASRIRTFLANPRIWRTFTDEVAEWLSLQQQRSQLPAADQLLIETFPRGGRHYLVAYCFEGRNAHQTLGMLLSRRMERAGLAPLGFVATDYVLAAWSLRPVTDVATFFAEDMLGDDLKEWMAESSILKRTFRNVAIVSGLIERRHPGREKTGRQVTFNSDLIYNVLRRYEPQHVLLRATRAEAARGLVDLARLADLLRRSRGRIAHRILPRISPMAVPVLLEIGRERVSGEADDELLEEAAEALIAEAAAPPAPRAATG